MHGRPHLSRPAAAGTAGLAGLAVLATVSLAGCGGTSSVTPAPQASDPACSALLGKLPAGVADQNRGTDPAAGAAAWGDPRIVLRCGLPPSGPTTTPCLDVDGVDWLVEETGDGFTLTTFGRRPAVEVTVPSSYGRSKASAAMVDLGPAVQALPVERTCT